MTPKYCPRCGHKILPNTSFCQNCGYKLSNNMTNTSTYNQYPKSPNNNHRYIGWIIAVVVIIVIGCGGYFASHSDSNSQTNQQNSAPSSNNSSNNGSSSNSNSNTHANGYDGNYYGMSHSAYKAEIGGMWTISVPDFANSMPHSKKEITEDAKYFKGGSSNKDYQAVYNWAKDMAKKDDPANSASHVDINDSVKSIKHEANHITVVRYEVNYFFYGKDGGERDQGFMWTAKFKDGVRNEFILSNKPDKKPTYNRKVY